MLRVTVGKSRKLSEDYNSTGFSISIDGEITAALDSPEQIIAQVQVLHDLATESLQDQVDRLKNTDLGTRHTADTTVSGSQPPRTNGQTNGRSRFPKNGSQATEVAATTKQVQYLLNLGKQNGFSKVDLEARVAKELNFNSVKSVYELSKSEATSAIDLIKA